ncbi:hypothetical protein OAV10_01725 [Hyphomicrobiales bacterium]|nr:hypothetical protein [Rhodobiaceae bacterium]MDC3320937.1 hypothetical protein [Hyphomicrobiales bacterium]
MNEFQIWSTLNSGLAMNGLFLIGFSFLAWFSGRASVIMHEKGNANLFGKIVVSAFSLSSLWYINMQFSYVALGISSASHSMAVLKEESGSVSARGQSLIDNFNGSTEVPTFSLVNEPAGLVLVIALAMCLLSGIWMGDSNNE